MLGEEASEGMDNSVFVVGVGSASTSIGTSGLEARNDFSGGVGVDGVAEGMVARATSASEGRRESRLAFDEGLMSNGGKTTLNGLADDGRLGEAERARRWASLRGGDALGGIPISSSYSPAFLLPTNSHSELPLPSSEFFSLLSVANFFPSSQNDSK